MATCGLARLPWSCRRVECVAAVSRNSRPRRQIIERDGKPMMVIRPSNPQLAILLANEAQRTQNQEAFTNLPAYAEKKGITYTFVGYLAKRPGGTACVVDKDRKVVSECLPGDSFVTERFVKGFKNPGEGQD